MPSLPIVKMARTVVESLLRGSACKMYPQRKPTFYKNTRGAVEIDTSTCILCGLCAKKCLPVALTVDRDNKTWEIDRLECIVCGTCVESCPKKALSFRNQYSPPATREMRELFHVTPPAPKHPQP